MKSFFENLFGKKVEGKTPELEKLGLYKKGDVIGGKYEVLGRLGEGGFGNVYLVRLHNIGGLNALKTIRHELIADHAARQAFKNEALLWLNLGLHPFIVPAFMVDEVSGQLFVGMAYIAPDAKGRVTLADHLARATAPFDTSQVLTWAIQFCFGMEHATAHGIVCHRDIKPTNILIAQNGTLLISDFGLAAAADAAWRRGSNRGGSLVKAVEGGGFGFSLIQADGKMRCGTPGYMAPEVYRCEAADIRSDIYSFGLVLWQMATGSPVPPFVLPYQGGLEGYLRQIYEQQMTCRVPCVDGFLGPVIERCLCPKPAERWGSFGELRGALEPILERKTGKRITVPQVGQESAAFWHLKGESLETLGRHKEAVSCYDKALKFDPRNAGFWICKGSALAALGQYETAISCMDKALTIDPRNVYAWINKAKVFLRLGRFAENNRCCDMALAIDPRMGRAWFLKATGLNALERFEDAVVCYDRALAIQSGDAAAWSGKGTTLTILGRREDALACFDKALAIDPLYPRALFGKAAREDALGRRREAAKYFQKYIEVASPEDAELIAAARQRLQELRASLN
jgi:serine/threonine protein kinase